MCRPSLFPIANIAGKHKTIFFVFPSTQMASQRQHKRTGMNLICIFSARSFYVLHAQNSAQPHAVEWIAKKSREPKIAIHPMPWLSKNKTHFTAFKRLYRQNAILIFHKTTRILYFPERKTRTGIHLVLFNLKETQTSLHSAIGHNNCLSMICIQKLYANIEKPFAWRFKGALYDSRGEASRELFTLDLFFRCACDACWESGMYIHRRQHMLWITWVKTLGKCVAIFSGFPRNLRECISWVFSRVDNIRNRWCAICGRMPYWMEMMNI